MKKNNYEVFFEKKWVKRTGVLCLIAVVLIEIVTLFEESNAHIIRIKPVSSINIEQPSTKKISATEITGTRLLKINNPAVADRLIFRTTETSALSDLLIYLYILLVLFSLTGEIKTGENNVFRNRMWNPLIQIGFLLMLMFLINVIKDLIAIQLVKKYTNGLYVPDERFFHWVQFWGGLILAYFGTIYKKGYDIQQEQDLTV